MDRAEAEAIYDAGRGGMCRVHSRAAARVEQHEERLARLEARASMPAPAACNTARCSPTSASNSPRTTTATHSPRSPEPHELNAYGFGPGVRETGPAEATGRRRGSRTQRSIHHSRSFAGCEKPRGSSPGAARWPGSPILPIRLGIGSVIRLRSVVLALCRRPTAAEENKPGLRCSNVHPPRAHSNNHLGRDG